MDAECRVGLTVHPAGMKRGMSMSGGRFRRHPRHVSGRLRRLTTGLGIAAMVLSSGLLLDAAGIRNHGTVLAAKLPTSSHSTTIALTSDDRRLLVVNREANSLSVIQVRAKPKKKDKGSGGMEWSTEPNGGFTTSDTPADALRDDATKLAEIPVGLEPRCVAVHPNDEEAYVTNGISGTVSVINLKKLRLIKTITVGTEPRGCALTPNGRFLYVANHTAGTVSIISTASRAVVGTVPVGGNPTAVAVSNNGENGSKDARVFVTQIFAELIPGGPGEGRNLGKRGVIHTFLVSNPTAITKITLSPLDDSGFTSNRVNFCPQFNANLHPPQKTNPIFCPDPTATDPTSDVITKNPQGVYPNQLLSALIRGNRLFLPNIGPQPEPVERLDTNVQALVHVVDTDALAELTAEHQNLNVQINTEPLPADLTSSLGHLFGNDVVAIDADPAGQVFLIVSRGGNYVLRAHLDESGKLTIDAPDNVVRFQTGNLPSGVVVSSDGKRAYANNEAGFSATAMNLDDNTVITRDIPSSEPPEIGTFEHGVLVGKLAFFTALGIPDNFLTNTPIRDFVPINFRGKMSANAWSSCGSCHPDGLADGVTWFFGTGPRQTISLDGMFSKSTNMEDQRLLNWSAVRGSNTDFNNNSRVTQGGCGFASDDFSAPGDCLAKGNATTANPAIYDHGITQGGSEALDVQTLWIFAAVRPLKQPVTTDINGFARGRTVFAASCASCHGGAKWTKSQIFHRDNPAAVAQGGAPLDPGVLNRANEFRSFTCNGTASSLTFNYLDDVLTFDVNNVLEARDINGITALGADGFNAPSLLSIRYSAPYLHRGQAQTLPEVFPLHGLPTGVAGATIATSLTTQQQKDLLVFLNSIDGTTDHLRSDGDRFRDALRLQGTCPKP